MEELYGAKDNGVKAFGNNSLGYDEEDKTNWDYYSAFFFSTTVVTTIGFGNIAPRYRFFASVGDGDSVTFFLFSGGYCSLI